MAGTSGKKRVAKDLAHVPAHCIVIDKTLVTSTPGTVPLADILAKQERRGLTVKVVDLDALFGPNIVLLLSPNASWWDVKMWGMLDMKVRGREAGLKASKAKGAKSGRSK